MTGAICRRSLHELREHVGRDRLRAVRERAVRVVVHLDHQPVGAHRRRRPRERAPPCRAGPVPWEGSTRIGRWESYFTAGTTARSRVLREKSEKVRTPRSQSTTS